MYTIRINEEQRKLISLALIHAIAGRHPMDVVDNEAEELASLHAMFVDLPESEGEDPGAIHGFCL